MDNMKFEAMNEAELMDTNGGCIIVGVISCILSAFKNICKPSKPSTGCGSKPSTGCGNSGGSSCGGSGNGSWSVGC